MTTLYTLAAVDVSVRDALIAFAHTMPDATATAPVLLYGVAECVLARYRRDDGRLTRLSDRNTEVEVHVADFYEARAFHAGAELRWLLRPEAADGRAVLLSDAEHRHENWTPGKIDVIGSLEQAYSLWGQRVEPSSPPAGWAILGDGRVGRFPVPLDAKLAGGAGVKLTVVEYLAEYRDGNVGVAEERLSGLAVVSNRREG